MAEGRSSAAARASELFKGRMFLSRKAEPRSEEYFISGGFFRSVDPNARSLGNRVLKKII